MEPITIPKRERDDSLETKSNKVPRFETRNGEFVWNELKSIVNVLVHNSQVKSTEINDILMIVSNDPDKITFFDVEYGTKNVETAIKKAAILLYPTGIIDESLSDFLWNKRNGLTTSFIMDNYRMPLWDIKTISMTLFKMNIFHIPPYHSIKFEAQQSELSIRMAVDPDSLRNKELSQEVGRSTSEIGISQCNHILERVMRGRYVDKSRFQLKRNKMILHHGRNYLSKVIHNYMQIFDEVLLIVRKYWNIEADHQKDALTVLLIMDSKLIYSKFLFNSVDYSNECLADIEESVEICLKRSVAFDNKEEIFLKDSKGFVDAAPVYPIIAQLHIPTLFKLGARLRKYLRQELNDEPTYNILESNSKYIVCSNPTAFEWLKTAIDDHNECVGKLASVSVEPIQMAYNQSMKVNMISQMRLTKPFNAYMENIKKYYPNLLTDLWIYLESVSDWEMSIEIDIQSIFELEQNKRRINVGGSLLKFEILYAQIFKSFGSYVL